MMDERTRELILISIAVRDKLWCACLVDALSIDEVAAVLTLFKDRRGDN